MSIQRLIKQAGYFNRIKNSSEELFSELSKLSESDLKDLERKFNPEEVFRPVVLLRFLIVELLLQKKEVNDEVVEDLKAAIENRDISKYYTASPELLNSLNAYKNSPKGMFPQWSNPFSILYPCFYASSLKEEVIDILKEVAQNIIEDHKLEDAVIHAVGFDGSQNYGDDVAWGAIIPKQADSVQKAYQIFFQINASGIKGGLIKGHKLVDEEFQNNLAEYNEWKEYLDVVNEIIPRWKEENSKLNFNLHADEKDFIKRLKQSSIYANQLYFSCIDGVINALGIAEDDNLVFSVSSDRLSFHIGSRYCLALQKNKFGFISPRKIDNHDLEVEAFKGDPEAYWYQTEDTEIVKEFSGHIIEAAQNELNRGHVAKESFKNVAFQKAVFDKRYRDEFFNTHLTSLFKGNIWKLGCKWGKGVKPSFYPFLIDNNCVIGRDVHHYKQGDLIAITNGHRVFAIGEIVGSRNPVTSDVSLQEVVSKYKIEYEDWVVITPADIIRLEPDDEFDYKLTQGICQVINPDIRKRIITLWDKYNSKRCNIKETKKVKLMTDTPLNQILYGPPGTGKTFNTINHALEICGVDLSGLSREEIKELYEQKVAEGQIVFTTFHQSMAYEDFVEGIKPVEPEKNGDPVTYRVEDGIFKRLCVEAAFSIAKENESEKTERVLDFSVAFDEFVHAIEEKFNADESVELETKNGGKVIVDSISPNGNVVIKHHGGEQRYIVSKERSLKLQEGVPDLNLVNNINDEFRAIIGGSNTSAYWSVLNAIRNDAYNGERVQNVKRKYSFEDKKQVVEALTRNDFGGKFGKPYVLIIDEINRGNVSQIFGELITLIEKDKRCGKSEALQIQLPYSKRSFGVPPNLYIIGTMNTADRSVEALDTALRRRFCFTEMAPDLTVIKNECKADNGIVDGIDLSELLNVINKRIEKLVDKDHMIGHSYFLSVESLSDLKASFKNNIIPLLQEYFFGDYGKIGLVLGSGFLYADKSEDDDDFFAPFDSYDSGSLSERTVYHLHDITKMEDDVFKSAINKMLRK